MTDKERIDALEEYVKEEGPLLIHQGVNDTHGWPGLGFWDGFRDLRNALDGLVRHSRQQPEGDKRSRK